MDIHLQPRPHSLGKLIEWKLLAAIADLSHPIGPHSLGKLIEWKRRDRSRRNDPFHVPTRWGN